MPELWPKLIEADKVNIGSTVWETDKLPSHWPELVRCVDRIFVPCEFNRPLFTLDNGPPVTVIPHIARSTRLPGDDGNIAALRKSLQIPAGHYVFYTIGTWSPRKALWNLLHAYLLAFTEQDAVTLVLKSEEKGDDPACEGHIRPVRDMVDDLVSNYPGSANVVVWSGFTADENITALHQMADCFASLTYSEGWGLGAFDAAAAGNPVIMTGWGGHLDFLPDSLAYLVQYELEPVRYFQNWVSYQPDQNWAKADINDAVHWLRHAFHNREEAASRGKQLKAFVATRFNRKVVMERFVDAVLSAHRQ